MSLIKYSLEFPIKTSVSVLYNRLSTPSGLSEWFIDNVNIKNNILTFFWEGSEEELSIVLKKKKMYLFNINGLRIIIKINTLSSRYKLIL